MEHCFPFEKVVALDGWVDTFTARFEEGLTDAWPDLAERLQRHVAALSWFELAAGPGKAFQQTRIEPTVKQWVQRYVEPIIDGARQQFRSSTGLECHQVQCDANTDVPAEGVFRTRDVLEGMALPGALLLGGGAVSVSLTTVTTWFVFTTLVVNWPLLIGGLLVGVALSAFGAARLAGLKARFRGRFEVSLLPPIRESIVGEGVDHGGRRVPSMKQQLQQQVRDSAALARKILAANG